MGLALALLVRAVLLHIVAYSIRETEIAIPWSVHRTPDDATTESCSFGSVTYINVPISRVLQLLFFLTAWR